MQRTKNGNLEIFDHPARIALDMATTRKGKKRSATEMVYICPRNRTYTEEDVMSPIMIMVPCYNEGDVSKLIAAREKPL